MKLTKPECCEDTPVLKYLCLRKKKALNPQGSLAGEEGIEPPLTVLETAALPLYYSPIFVSSATDKWNYIK